MVGSMEEERNAIWSSFLAHAESDVRHQQRHAEVTIRPSVACCFAVGSGPFWRPELEAWKLQFGASFLPIQKATLVAEGTIRPSVAFCFAVASGPFWCPESCSLERVATQWDIWIGHPHVPAFLLNQLFVNGDQLSQEPDRRFYEHSARFPQSVYWDISSRIWSWSYLSILFWGLFELASDRDWL